MRTASRPAKGEPLGQQQRSILLVDDDPESRRRLRQVLSAGFTVKEAASGKEALKIAISWSPDLVLLDLMAAGINGSETCRRLKAGPSARPPQVIMVSGMPGTAEQITAFEAGADDYMAKPVDPSDLRSRVELHFRLRDSQAAAELLQQQLSSHQSALKQESCKRSEATLAVQDVAVFTLAKIAESRDNETGEHIVRMREYSQVLAHELQAHSPYADAIDATFLDDLYRSSPLHDIGKVGIPDSVLLKPGRLSLEEFEIMKRHTVIGSNVLREAVVQLNGGGFLTMASKIAEFHHERWDGKGYLAGMSGDEIPLPARIVAVADVYDALTSQRPYKEAWPSDRAKQTIDQGAGTQFDPFVVAAFDRCFEKVLRIQREHADRNPTCVGAMAFLEYDLLETP